MRPLHQQVLQRGLGLAHDAVDELLAARQVVDQADDLAARHHARVGVALHHDACSSIGVLAAITVCAHESSSIFRIARASRIRSQRAPDMRWKRTALANARGRSRAPRAEEPLDEGRAQHAMRPAVDLRRHDGAGDRRRDRAS